MAGSRGGVRLHIVVYRITGRQGPVTIPDWVCPECDLTVTTVQRAVRDAGVEASITVKPWLAHLREAVKLGAYHPPVVVIDGSVYSQEVVPDLDTLTAQLLRLSSPSSATVDHRCACLGGSHAT